MKKTEEIKKIIEHHRELFYKRKISGELFPRILARETHKEIVFDEMCGAIETVCNRDTDDSINDELWSNND
jgi:hypothetical protein